MVSCGLFIAELYNSMKSVIGQRNFFNIGLHILVWGILLAIPIVIFADHRFEGLTHTFFWVTCLVHIGLFYFNAYFLYPRLLTRKWWWLYIISLAATVVLINRGKIFFLELDPGFTLTDVNRRVIFFGVIPFIIASIIFRLINDRIHFERMEKEAQAEHPYW